MTGPATAIVSGRLSLTVDSHVGGRITSCRFDGFEFLTGPDTHPLNFGATFWPSPQALWNWPPLAALDSDPYVVIETSPVLRMRSAVDPGTGLRVGKELEKKGADRVAVRYLLGNAGELPVAVAPWEISRVRKEGLFFFPRGITPMTKKHFPPVRLQEQEGIVWYRDQKALRDHNTLNVADGSEGWMAYVVEGRALIKIFADVPPDQQAPGEGEVLLYTSMEAAYLELEAQGAYTSIAPGEERLWEIQWMGGVVPAEIAVEPGSAPLVEWVRARVREAHAS